MHRTVTSFVVVAFAWCGGWPLQAFGESTRCASFTVVPPDGRGLDGQIPATTGFWFGFRAMPNRSYSIEVTARGTERGVTPGTLELVKSCGEEVAARDTTTLEPSIVGLGSRLSFVADSNAFYTFRVLNSRATAVPYTVAVSETTFFCSAFRDSSGEPTRSRTRLFHIANTTRGAINLTFTTFIDGTLQRNFHGRVPTDEILVTFYLADLSLEFLEAERAIIAHDGPPGAIVVDAADTAFEAPGIRSPVPVTCAAVRDGRSR